MKRLSIEMPWKGVEIPHAVIEVNQNCNINCFGCCKDKMNYSKSLSEIKSEIDLISSKRNLAALSIAGGEPLLYHDLCEVISYIKQKKIRVILLTNGTLVNIENLTKMKDAGLSRIVFHVDSHQDGRPDVKLPCTEKKLNELRKKYLDMCKEVNLEIGFTVTIYQDTLNQLQDVLSFCQDESHIKFLLVMGYSQLVNYNEKLDKKYQRDDLSIKSHDALTYMLDKEKATPVFHIPSSHNKNESRWNFYILSIIHQNNEKKDIFYLHPSSQITFYLLPRLQRILKGRYSFDDQVNLFQILIMLILHAVFSFQLSIIIRTVKHLFTAIINQNIRFQTYVFQHPPNQLGNNEYEICANCPDITVRQNQLVPTCLADVLYPIHIKNQEDV